jgi:hypothetical protein
LSSRHARLDELGDWVLPEAGEYLTYFSDEKRAAFRALRESIEKHTVPAAYEAFRSFTFLEKWSSKFILSQEKWSFDHFEVNSIVQRLDSTTEAVFNPPSSYVIDKATYSNSPINDVPVGDAVPLAAA